MKNYFYNIDGFGLIEMTIIIITIGILASIAMQSMTALIIDTRQVKTEREMELLANAIVGNPNVTSGAIRGDFGYIGDVGSFPPNLDALVTNPGGYTTWDGPYISTEFSQDTDGFKTDEWGTAYSYSGGLTITSNGSGSSLTKKIADATADYTLNNFNGTVLDASGTVPSITYLDSVNINITIPNGTGGSITKSYIPDSSGAFIMDSLPVGQHPLRIIYTPNVDTLYSRLTILPRHKTDRTYKFASSYFTSSGGGGGGPVSGVEILRPNGVGSVTQLSNQGCSNNWQCLSEVNADESSSGVWNTSSSWLYDLYTTENSVVGSGTIDSLVFYYRGIGVGGGISTLYLQTYGTPFYSTALITNAAYTTLNILVATNPVTGSPWTWTEVNDLQLGAGSFNNGFMTQVWVEVHYTN